MAKKSYHSDFILQYKLGLLPSDRVKSIPTSTRHYWSKNDYSKLIGCEYTVLDKDDTIDLVFGIQMGFCIAAIGLLGKIYLIASLIAALCLFMFCLLGGKPLWMIVFFTAFPAWNGWYFYKLTAT